MRADCLPFASVSVRVNGEVLHEYQTEGTSADEAMTATAYIESVDGAEFDVSVLVQTAFAYKSDCLEFVIHIDGKWMAGQVVHLNGKRKLGAVDGATCPAESGRATFRKFKFAAHDMIDANPGAGLKTNEYSRLGEIAVKLTRCRDNGKSRPPDKSEFEPLGKGGIPEKALKGRSVSHHAELGPAQAITTSWANVTYPHGKQPIATYKFFYRSRKDLQIEGIIARSPSPVPLEDRDPDELTLDEARELLRRQRTLAEARVKIKQEGAHQKRRRSATLEGDHVRSDGNDEDGEDGDVTIVSESDARKRARNAEVVDLTGV